MTCVHAVRYSATQSQAASRQAYCIQRQRDTAVSNVSAKWHACADVPCGDVLLPCNTHNSEPLLQRGTAAEASSEDGAALSKEKQSTQRS